MCRSWFGLLVSVQLLVGGATVPDRLIGTWKAERQKTLIFARDGSWRYEDAGGVVTATPEEAGRCVISGAGVSGVTVETYWLDATTAERSWRERNGSVYRSDRLTLSADGSRLTISETWLSPPAAKARKQTTLWRRAKRP